MTGAGSAQRSGRLSRRPPPFPRRALSLAAAILLAGAVGPAPAQTARPRIAVAATVLVEPGKHVRLPLQVGPPGALPAGCFIRLRGLPATAALSEGYAIAPGAWTIPLVALPTLTVVFPTEATGRTELSITLVSPDGSALAESKVALVVTAAAPAPHAEPPEEKATLLRRSGRGSPPGASPPRPAVPSIGAEARERALRLVKKGDAQLAQGGIAQARLLYERAADAGLALGALAMAATYDPAELQRLGVLGLRPDQELARRWYERALQLGAPEAEQRLQRLGEK